MSYLVLDALSKHYEGLTAVKSLSLAVEKGEFIALLGPSGCGKTTTLQMIAGFVEPSAGDIRIEGNSIVGVRPSERALGIVFQSYALFPHMTAAENVAFGLEMQGVDRAERDARVSKALDMVGLAQLKDRHPRRMSGGQQQRVALARALVIRPRILLLDEPLSNLDAKLREEMQIELRQIQRNLGTTTILVTHDQSEAMALADRIVVMNKGMAEQVAPPFEAYENPATAFVANFLGKTNVIAGSADADGLVTFAGGLAAPVAGAGAGPVRLSIRPEKLRFAQGGEAGLPATIRTRIFQGNHFLYQAEWNGQLLTIIRQNDGSAPHDEGEAVRLIWRVEDGRLLGPQA